MNLAALSEEEKLFLAKLEDTFRLCEQRNAPKFLGFLDERQQDLTMAYAKQTGKDNYLLYGGYEGAERKVLGAFPSYLDCETASLEELFACVAPLTARFRPVDRLTHRDFLGSLMALNLTRESVGDILTGEGMAVIFVLSPVKRLVLEELSKAGRVGLRWEEGLPEQLPQGQGFVEIRDTVSSLRLDSVISVATRQSREKAAKLI